MLLAEEHSAAAYKMGLRPDTTVYTLLTWAVLWSLFSRLAGDSEAAAVYCAAFVRTVSGTSAGAAPVERVGGTADTGYLSAPVQMFALALAGGLAIAVTLSYLPFGEYLGGAKRTKKSCKGEHNGKKENRRTKSI